MIDFKNITPSVKNLIIINLIMFGANFILKLLHIIDLNHSLGLYYFGIPEFKIYQIFSNMFMHANLTHILFNLFSLYSVGTLLEKVWGSKRFLHFYLICGIGASIFHLLVFAFFAYSDFGQFMIDTSFYENIDSKFFTCAIGASGAICGVFTAIALLFPNSEFYVFFIPVPIKAKYLLIAFVVIDMFFGLNQVKGDNIGHFAHLGGVLTGFIMVKFFNKDKSRFY